MPNRVTLLQAIFLVFFGGGMGSVVRFLVSHYISKILEFGKFPLGTFLVNIIGSFLIGFLMVKFCGGFTTFSTFSSENYNLWIGQHYILLFLNIFLSLFLGILAVFLGFFMGKQ